MCVYEFDDGDVNIGNLGETKLTEWCDAARLTSNESLHEDKMGWDHFIEFPYLKSDEPKDKQSKPIECKIQVKSTFREDGGVQIKLSALKRLVDYTSPAFILFYEFKDKENPKLDSAYLVHVDETLITRVLKRIREEHISDNTVPLNKIKLWVGYADEHKLESNNGIALRDQISRLVPDGMAKYQQNKDELTKTVGYGDNGFIFQFQASTEQMTQHLVEAAVGVSSEIEIKNTILKDNRFDLPNGAIEEEKSDIAKIEVLPNIIDKCQLRFKVSEYSPALTFDGEFIKMPQLTTSKNSLYFRTKLFSVELIDVLQSSFDCQLYFTFEKEVPLDEALRFFTLFSKENKGKTLRLEVELKKERRIIKLKATLNHEFEDAFSVVESVKVIKNSFEIDGNSPITLQYLYDCRDALNGLAAIIQNKVETMRFKLRDELDSEGDITAREAVCPYTMIVQIGDSHIGVVVLLYGKKITDYDYQVYNAEVVKALTFHGEAPTSELLNKIQNTALQKSNDLND
ncbi:hypothetical protein CWN95_22165 [Vibrio splendidus]|nr:hypothetical protein A144_13560 [Vibrio splendidus ZF-90]PTP29076.1 hypothetical protein CWN95_22165 [Vibrio splendidus]